MSKNEVIERFCKLSAEVMRRKFKCNYAADCFCGNHAPDWNYSYSEKILKFIEESVREKLNN